MGFASRPNKVDGPPSRTSSVASSGTTPAPSTSASARTSSISSDDANNGARPGQSPARGAPGHTLEAPSRKNRPGRSPSRPLQLFQKLRRALPILAPRCGRTPAGSSSGTADSHLMSRHVASGGGRRPCRRVTGTLFGRRKGRVALALQETPRSLPSLVVELALQTHALLRELGNPAGARIVLETERRRGGEGPKRAPPLLDEAAWTMFCNGRKTGYAVRREATDYDLTVMETLRAVSMGAGVLPVPAGGGAGGGGSGSAPDDEVAYMRGCFEHLVGSWDSESLYMVTPQGGGTGPELAVFFVRL
ncbi:protein MIZU-KUSSEI 1-like [Triticum dicoccoides]|uniref:protein MIZU-KUSSEI 1-like n=1 Tax=Triticum dicoccoides TaxID=85692 RepID=UPI000844F264|nr:protein MIZU-KUSSEI 1-like [Triticum dicoccoides]XP_044391949.1 protein MIZU-KUSSEI 1-like [Triticum aestivum]